MKTTIRSPFYGRAIFKFDSSQSIPCRNYLLVRFCDETFLSLFSTSIKLNHRNKLTSVVCVLQNRGFISHFQNACIFQSIRLFPFSISFEVLKYLQDLFSVTNKSLNFSYFWREKKGRESVRKMSRIRTKSESETSADRIGEIRGRFKLRLHYFCFIISILLQTPWVRVV